MAKKTAKGKLRLEGKYTLSKKGKKAHDTLCSDLKTINRAFREDSEEKLGAGDYAGAVESARNADRARADAQKFGCKWAGR